MKEFDFKCSLRFRKWSSNCWSETLYDYVLWHTVLLQFIVYLQMLLVGLQRQTGVTSIINKLYMAKSLRVNLSIVKDKGSSI